MTVDRSREPAPGPIRDYLFPSIERRLLDNGVRSVVCTSGDVPLITAYVIVDAGAGSERAGYEGIAMLTANSLEGGTANRTGVDLAWALEELGLELSSWATWDATHVRVTATTQRIDAALGLLADIIRNPAFPPKEVERMRGEQLAEILQRSTEPRALADDMAVQHIFAEGSAYGRSIYGDPERVASFTNEDARAFHAARYSPETTSVILVGDIDAPRGHALIQSVFGEWSGTPTATDPLKNEAAGTGIRIRLIDRPGSVQSELRMGHVGVERNHPDHFLLLVLNAILGGAFTSRLNLSLREKHGFTYGVRSSFAFRTGPGPFVIQTAVGTDVTSRALDEAFKEVRKLLEEGPTESEVANARDYLAGIFPLQLQSTEELAAKIGETVIYDLPSDYFQSYRERILDVNRDAVATALKQYIRPEDMSVVIAGDATAIRADIEKLALGEVVIEQAEAGAEV